MAIPRISSRDAFLTAEEFRLAQISPEVVQFSFGPTSVSMSLDAVYDFQYRLAAFLAGIELDEDYSEHEAELSGEGASLACGCEEGIEQSRAALEAFTAFFAGRRKLDS